MVNGISRILAIALLLPLLTSLAVIHHVNASTDVEYGRKKWTFMVYIVADNDLDPYAEPDLQEMMAVGSSDEVNVIALVDLLYTKGTVVYYIEKGGKTVIWGDWKEEYELNTGDPATLTWFINEVSQKYPAEHYVLVLWNHGDSWNGFGWDDTNGDHLTIEEIKVALTNINVNIDVLGFDACLMAGIEVLYTIGLAGTVDIVVASEEYVPGYGWPYDKILEKLVNNPIMKPVELAITIVDEYIGSYTRGSQGIAPYVTMSVVNARATANLTKQLGLFTEVLLANIDRYRPSVKAASQSAERFWFGMWYQGPYIDLRDFLQRLSKYDKRLEQYITPLLNVWNNVVIYIKSTRGPHITGAYGLTIYFPRNRHHFYDLELYRKSVPDFVRETKWDRLLKAILE